MTEVMAIPALDWARIGVELDAYGCAVARGVLSRDESRGSPGCIHPIHRSAAAS